MPTCRSKKLWVPIAAGALIAIGSFVGLDNVTGGILRSSADVPQLRASVLLNCPDLPLGGVPSFQVRVSLRHPDDIEFQIRPFETILDGKLRVDALKSCATMTVGTNFMPVDPIVEASRDSLREHLKTCRNGEYCLILDRDRLLRSRGRVSFKAGTGLSYESLSGRAVDLIVGAAQAGSEVELSVALPDRFFPESSLPGPDFMSSMAWTTMYWKGSNEFGRTAPEGGPMSVGKRERLQEIGVQLRISSPRLKRLETTLVFLLSAFFGIGFAICVDAPIRRAVGHKD